MQGNIWPEMFNDSRSNAMTRDACRALHVTPYHSQNLRDVLFLHEAKAPDGSESWDRRQRRACSSDSLWSTGVGSAKELTWRPLLKKWMRIGTSRSEIESLRVAT
jgi:hypothetical protein